jgi:predicted Zn-dependent protease
MRTARPLVAKVLRADADNRRGLASKVLFNVARYHHLRGDQNWRAALAAFADLARRFPTSNEVRGGAFAIDTAKALHRLGRDAEAMAALERYVGQGADDVDRYNTVAFFLYRENWALARGEGFARHGLEVSPADHSLWDTFAEILAARGKLDEAIAAAERARDLDPEAPYYAMQVARFRSMQSAARP